MIHKLHSSESINLQWSYEVLWLVNKPYEEGVEKMESDSSSMCQVLWQEVADTR